MNILYILGIYFGMVVLVNIFDSFIGFNDEFLGTDDLHSAAFLWFIFIPFYIIFCFWSLLIFVKNKRLSKKNA